MLKSGMAYYLGSTTNDPELAKASEYARSEKTGIYSSKCTQTENTENPKCVIKGNYPGFTGKNGVYHFPGCNNYTITKLELYKGDQWFCTEKEAQQAGFTKGADCFEKTWK
jgi:micrococcal nuclease